MLINGEWLKGSSQFDVMDPATSRALGQVADATVEEGLAAVSAAHEAFGTW
ncbi:MAG: hypothetical protein RIS75_228, partial [Actinomycetota bacterium]